MKKTAPCGKRFLLFLLGVLLVQAFFPVLTEAFILSLPPQVPEDSAVLSGRGKILLPHPLPTDLTVRLFSSNPSRAAVPEKVVIRAGDTLASFDITIVDNRELEGSRTVDITAFTEDGASEKQTLTILDNEPGQVSFSSEAYSVGEEDESALITVVRTSSSSGEIRVEYETVNGTASAGADYESVSGTLTFHHGEVTKTFSIRILNDSAAEEDKSVKIKLSNPGGGAMLRTPSLATLTIKDDDPPDFFTEFFDQGDNDLRNQTLTFVPDGSRSFYAVCRTPAYSFPADPSGGERLNLGDDEAVTVRLAAGKEIPFYGARYGRFSVGSNGYVTFSAGDHSYQESLEAHFSQPRISALFDDLNPAHGGTISWKQQRDRAVVTFQEVAENRSGKRSSFQVEMFFDGILRITHLDLGVGDGLVGLSRGEGRPAEFAESDLSAYPACFFLSLPESVTEGKDTDVLAPGTLGALIPPPATVKILLASSDPTECNVDKTVLFPAGESSVLFDLTTVDDDLLDGSQCVTITATLPGGGTISGCVRVHDNETATLSVELPETAREGEGVLHGGGIVRVSAPVNKDVAVSLSSDDPSEVTVPKSVTIPKGGGSASFDLAIGNDVVVDGPRTVVITATVTGWTSGSASVVIQDQEEDARFAPAVGAGDGHSVALKDDGTLWVWGDNGCGQLGEGTTKDRNAPIPVTALKDVFAVAGGGNHTLALTGDGRVWAWGDNSGGQLGDGTFLSRPRPVPVGSLTEGVAIAAGYSHSLMLKKDGTVWAWGDNSSGQLGNGTTESRSWPERVSGLTDVLAIAAGHDHNFALKKDGTLWSWGANGDGQLGDGSLSARTLPVQVPGLSQVVFVAAGAYHSLAVQQDQKAWAWGRNWEGQLGEGVFEHRTTPVRIEGLTGVILVAAGASHSLALKSNGTVWACGANLHGQLGDGTFQGSDTPVPVSGLAGVIGLAAGVNHSVALRNDGTLWSWGENGSGQLGDGTFGGKNVPAQVIGSSGEEPLDLIALSVVLPSQVNEGDGVLVGKGAVIVRDTLKTDLCATLASNNPSKVSVTERLVIPADHTSASFDLTIPDDSLLDGPQAIRVTAFALGYVTAGATVEVNDNERAELSIEVPFSVMESDGWLPQRGKVSLSALPDTDITVYLNSQDTTVVEVPATVVIPAGRPSAPFSLVVLDNGEADGPRHVRITATVPGWGSTVQGVRVEDNEPSDLFLAMEEETPEGEALKRVGTVSILAPLPSDLVIDLFTDDPSGGRVPPFVVIPAGETIVLFDLSIGGSGKRNPEILTVTAAAPGWSPGVLVIRLKKSDANPS